jgi:exoribonuclease-2
MRENLVRLDGLPLITRVSSLPGLEADTAVRLAVEEVDLIECKLLCRWISTPNRSDAAACKQARS